MVIGFPILYYITLRNSRELNNLIEIRAVTMSDFHYEIMAVKRIYNTNIIAISKN